MSNSTSLVNELKSLNGDTEFFEEVARLAANVNDAVKRNGPLSGNLSFDNMGRVTAGLVSGIVGALITKYGG